MAKSNGRRNGAKPKGKRGTIKSFNKRRSIRAQGSQILGQAVAAAPPAPFGNGMVHAAPRCKYDLRCWDAKLPMHLPLPRAVGPYLTVRVTHRFNTADKVVMICPFRHYGGQPGRLESGAWTDVVALSSANATLPVSDVSSTNYHKVDISGIGSNCTLVPSAITVQIMNPNAVTGATGIMYGGVSQTQIPAGGTATTWNAIAENFIQFQKPRLMSGGKLALRGVQASSYPLNMSALSDFTETMTSFTSGTDQWHSSALPTGFAPIIFVNAGYTASGITVTQSMEYLVTMEMRVRFDFSNPASAAHIQHPVSSDSTWGDLISAASSLGHGVMDIAEAVADNGQSASKLLSRAAAYLPKIL